MDPILIAMHINRELYFLARGEAFENKLASRILSHLNLIPIYRPEISPEKLTENKNIFRKCHSHLSSGNCLLIFPEGFSKTERRLRKIKTGTARIALGTEAKNSFKLGLKIVPIGINYTNPHLFQSEVFINIGHSITLERFKNEYQHNQFSAARKLTNEIKTELEDRTVVIEHEELDQLVSKIERLYEDELKESLDTQNSDKFLLSKQIVKAVNYFYLNDKIRVFRFKQKLDTYFNKLKNLDLKDSQVKYAEVRGNLFLKFLFLASLSPLFIYGLVNNIIPLKLSAFLATKMTKREDFKGSLLLSMGLLCFLFLYLSQSIIVSIFSSSFIGFLYFLSLYPSGLFCLTYAKVFLKTRNRLKILLSRSEEGSPIKSLIKERKLLIEVLEKNRVEFLQQEIDLQKNLTQN
jgi:1-acyl-sn-glycerol-3-phosphate acyltransferase